MSENQDQIIKVINDELDARQVLELIGYETDKIQQSDGTIRAFCPIHNEALFRTLVVDPFTKHFTCNYSLCEGASGGNIVTLYALAKKLTAEDAAQELAKEFNIALPTPPDSDVILRQLEIASNLLDLEHPEEAEMAYREVLNLDPSNELAIDGLLKVYDLAGDPSRAVEIRELAVRRHLERCEFDRALVQAEVLVETAPDEPRVHELLAECHLGAMDLESALEEFMAMADAAESKSDYDQALHAYMRADELNLDIVDVHSHIQRIFDIMQSPERGEEYLVTKAERSAAATDYIRAATLYEDLLETCPNRHDWRRRFAEIAALADPAETWLPKIFQSVDHFCKINEHSHAADTLQRLLEIRPENITALERLASVYEAKELKSDALATRVRLASALYRQGNVDESVTQLQQMLTANPQNCEILELLGDIEATRGNLESAEAALLQLGEAFLVRDEYQKAVESFTRLIEMRPGDSKYRERRAAAYEYWASHGDTAASLLGARDYEDLGEIFYQETDASRSIEYYEKAMTLIDATSSLCLKLARAYLRARNMSRAADMAMLASERLYHEGHPDEAVLEADQFAELIPEELKLSRFAAELHARRGDKGAAVSRLKRLGQYLSARGETQEAATMYSQASRLDPNDMDVLAELVQAQETLGDIESAYATRLQIAECHERNGRIGHAVAALEQAFVARPNDATIASRLVRMHENNSNISEAQRWRFKISAIRRSQDDLTGSRNMILEALDREPNNQQALMLLIEFELNANRRDEAALLACRLARLQNEEGRHGDAIVTLERALERVPNSIQISKILFETYCVNNSIDRARNLGKQLVGLLATENDFVSAADIFNRLVEISPEDLGLRREQVDFLKGHGYTAEAIASLYGLAFTYRATGDSAKFERVLLEVLELDAQNLDARQELIAHYKSVEDFDLADEHTRLLAIANYEIGGEEIAISLLETLLHERPNNNRARRQYLEYLLRAGLKDKAVASLFEQADILLASGAEVEALSCEREAREIMPDDLAIRRRYAESLVRYGDMLNAVNELLLIAEREQAASDDEAAMQTIERILAIQPENLPARTGRIAILSRTGRLEEAQAARTELYLAEALGKARAHRESLQFDQEALVLRDALQELPDNTIIIREIADCEYRRGDLSSGSSWTRKLAEVHLRSDRIADAADVLISALSKSPTDASLGIELFRIHVLQGETADAVLRGQATADILVQNGRVDEAINLLDEVIAVDPTDAALQKNLITFLRRVGRFDDAQRRQSELARRLIESKDLDESEKLLRENLVAAPDSFETRRDLIRIMTLRGDRDALENETSELAKAQYRTGEVADAMTTLRGILAIHPHSIAPRRQLANYLQEQHDIARAVQALHELADAYRVADSHDEALDIEREAVGIAALDTHARSRLADSLILAGLSAEAITHLEALLKIHLDANAPEDALRTVEKLLVVAPDLTAAKLQRAELLAQTGQADLALEAFRELSANLSAGSLEQRAESGPAAAANWDPYQQLSIVPEYDFERFVVGGNNQFAHATALAAARNPAGAYNPLFLYSNVGLGKTHLANAIANHILRERPESRIIYTNSEDFTTEVVEGIQRNAIPALRTRYKGADLLIVEDIQFLAGKQRAQEEFFHVFNALFQAKRQIVITSDRPPKEISHLEDRLLSRFASGIIVDIGQPDVETRTAILMREIERTNAGLDASIALVIAETIGSSIRELKSALKQVVALRDIQGLELTPLSVRSALDKTYATKLEEDPDLELI